jgi:hypothetical protein
MRNVIKFSLSKHKDVVICVDSDKADEILPFIHDNDDVLKEFFRIRGILLENLRSSEYYLKVKGTNNMFEMRFTSGRRNDRIYCKEIRTSKRRYIIMAYLFEGKKTNEIPKNVLKSIQTIDKYEYNV